MHIPCLSSDGSSDNRFIAWADRAGLIQRRHGVNAGRLRILQNSSPKAYLLRHNTMRRRGRHDHGAVDLHPAHRFEVLHLPGLEGAVSAEIRAALGTAVTPVAQRDDSLQLDFTGTWERLLALRTPVSVFA